ncbi:hypothetical protein D6D11_09769 [Aureobasidium pullulans]|nr:hypothetical protein D6D11_09769 [Aureobasidium pullulans]THX41617.1 hypothetical protein D6D08_10609 [Aureobasidium pullulans]
MTGLTGKPGSVGLGLWTMASTSPTRGSSMMLGPGILSDTVILTNFNGDAPYLYHPRSGICATLQPGLSSTGDMQMLGNARALWLQRRASGEPGLAINTSPVKWSMCHGCRDRGALWPSGFYLAINNNGYFVSLKAGDGGCFYLQ